MASSTTVEIGVYLTTGDTPYFRLDDPVKGKLNNVTYRLAGPIYYDVSDYVTSVAVKRGKNRELDRYSAASASVTLNNEDRLFDPLNTAGIFYGNIIPRRQIRIRTGGYDQFVGVIEDWNLDYSVSGESVAQIQAADGFALLAQQTLTPGTATPQLTGERVAAVLSQPTVGWPLQQRNLDAGTNTVGADVFDGNVLSYLQSVESSEQGQLFMDRSGNVRFVNGAVTVTSELSAVFFSDDGTGVPYTNATVSYGTELLFNQVSVSSPAGTAIQNNTVSQDKYGITQTSVDTLLSTYSQTESLASFWVNKYGEPEYRFQDLTVSLEGITGAQANQVLQVELGDIIQIKFTPNQVGAPIERYGQIISIAHAVGPARHDITFSIGSLQYSFLVLDDVGFGILDENALAF
jgi:hypothetical protein